MTYQTSTVSSQPIIVVSGATGKTGREVVKQLSTRQDVKVRAAVHSLEKATILPDGVDVVHIDYDKPETVFSALIGASKLYLVPLGERDKIHDTQVVVEAAKKTDIQHIVLISGIVPDREPINSYDRIFTQVETIVAGCGINYTILRPSWFAQNFTPYGYFGLQVNLGILRLPMGEGKTGWVDCRDIASVAVKVLTETGHENKVYNPTGSETLTLNEVTAILSKVMNREIKFIDISEEEYAQMLCAVGVSQRNIQQMVEHVRKSRQGYHADVTQDIEKITGNKPISFEQFAIDHAHLLRQSDRSKNQVLAK